MSVELDPREVLAHLNSLGYRNISAYVLKEFIKNLKKLIAYDTRRSVQLPNERATVRVTDSHLKKNNFQDHFEHLYKKTTEAAKARNNAKHKQVDKENGDPYDPYKFDRIRLDEADVPPKKCKPANQPKRTIQIAVQSKICENALKRPQPSRTSSATTASYFIRNTPTDLYQNYQREWSRFKHMLPGENPRNNERQIIRKKMETIQKPQPKPKVFVLMNDDNTKIIRRQCP